MSRIVCFIDEEDGQSAICLMEINRPEYEPCCENCGHNPFPGKIIPKDRVLRKLTFDPCV